MKLWAALLASLWLITGCGPKKEPMPYSTTHTAGNQAGVEEIHIKGSDTMTPLIHAWAEMFMSDNPDVAVYVSGGGSRTGIEGLINSTVDICSSSRPMKPSEIKRLFQKHGSLGTSISSAKDALCIYLNPQNPIRDLTTDQLRQIFTGAITNWSRVGGENRPIKIISRQPNSGTYLFLKEHLLHAEAYAGGARAMQTTAAVVKAVADEPGAIGYGGIAFSDGIVQCRVNNVTPSMESVNNGRYPLARYLYFYTVGKPEGAVRRFIDAVLSRKGQEVTGHEGFVPLWKPDDSL